MLRHTFTLGHIAAIPVRLHWSWPIILGLLIAASGPIYARYIDGAGAWVLGAVMGLLVCGSVLLHEVSHALVAQRFAVPVRHITLFAFGGVAEVQTESPGPGQEFAIAVAGPAMSLLIAVSCGLAWLALTVYGGPALLAVLAAHLAAANGLMAVFNMLPGYPMDGGRVLRAILWFLGDDVLRATQIAAWVGRGCGVLIGLFGLFLAIATGQLFAILWCGLIGLFLYRIAAHSYEQLAVQTALYNVRVEDLMQRHFRAISPELTLEQFIGRYLLGQMDTSFPVVRHESRDDLAQRPAPILAGMMTLREMRRFTIHEWAFTHVGTAMTPLNQLRTVSPHQNAGEALRLMNDTHTDTLPVTDGSHVVGLLYHRDLVIYIQMKLAQLKREM